MTYDDTLLSSLHLERDGADWQWLLSLASQTEAVFNSVCRVHQNQLALKDTPAHITSTSQPRQTTRITEPNKKIYSVSQKNTPTLAVSYSVSQKNTPTLAVRCYTTKA